MEFCRAVGLRQCAEAMLEAWQYLVRHDLGAGSHDVLLSPQKPGLFTVKAETQPVIGERRIVICQQPHHYERQRYLGVHRWAVALCCVKDGLARAGIRPAIPGCGWGAKDGVQDSQ